MKGLTATLSVLLIFSILLSLAVMISIKNREFNETLNKLFVADRVFAKYDGIESGLLGIMKEVFGTNVTVQEGSTNIVTFQETLPHLDSNVYAYQQSLNNLTYFVSNYMNESNLQTSLKSDEIRDNLLLMVKPYDINYTHPITSEIRGWERFLYVIPKDASKLNEYNITLILKNAVIKGQQQQGECSEGNLKWNIMLTDTKKRYDPVVISLAPNSPCTYRINTRDMPYQDQGKILINNADRGDGSLTIDYHVSDIDNPLIFNSTISLTLTDVTDKVKITLLPDIIKVNEVLYSIGRNDTAYIY